jgi:phosphotransferase system HPr-like phosphotransfer protein
MFLMAASLNCGSEIQVVSYGPGEETALSENSAFIEAGMGD